MYYYGVLLLQLYSVHSTRVEMTHCRRTISPNFLTANSVDSQFPGHKNRNDTEARTGQTGPLEVGPGGDFPRHRFSRQTLWLMQNIHHMPVFMEQPLVISTDVRLSEISSATAYRTVALLLPLLPIGHGHFQCGMNYIA